MRQAGGTNRDEDTGDMSTAEVFRFYREFKKLQEEAGIPPYDPRDKDAIRKGFFGDGYDMSLRGIEKSNKTGPPR